MVKYGLLNKQSNDRYSRDIFDVFIFLGERRHRNSNQQAQSNNKENI